MDVDFTQGITKVYDKIIEEAKNGVELAPIERDKRKPVSYVIEKINEMDVDEIAKKIPIRKSVILDALLPTQARGLVGVVSHVGKLLKSNRTEDVKKAVAGLEKLSLAVGNDPEKGRLSKGIKRIKKSFKLDTVDKVTENEVDNLVNEGDKVALLIKQLKVDNAKEFLNQQVTDRFENDTRNKYLENSNQYLRNMDVNIAAIAKYQGTITNKYQQLSLKVKYETLYVLKEILATTLSYHRVSRNQLSALVYNSSLPDSQKATLIDLGIHKARLRLVDKAEGKINVIKRLVSGRAGGILTGGNDTDPTLDILRTRNLPGISDNKIVNTASPGFIEGLRNKVRGKVDDTLYGGGRLSALGNLLTSITSSLGDTVSKNRDKKGIKGILSRLTLNALEIGEQAARGVGGNRFSDDETAIFDGRTYNTINTIIPAYLAKLLQSSEGIRTGTEADLEAYVRSSNTFQKESQINRAVEDVTKDAVSRIDIDSDVDRVMDLIQKRQTLTGDAEKAMRSLVKETIVTNYASDNPFGNVTDLMGMLNSDAFKSIVPEDQKAEVENVLKDSKNMLSARELSLLTKGLLQGDEATLRLKRVVKSLVDFYGTAPLVKQGVIEVDNDGYYLSKDFVSEALRGAISDDIKSRTGDREYDPEPTDNPEDKTLTRKKFKAAVEEAYNNLNDLKDKTQEVVSKTKTAIEEETPKIIDKLKVEYKNFTDALNGKLKLKERSDSIMSEAQTLISGKAKDLDARKDAFIKQMKDSGIKSREDIITFIKAQSERLNETRDKSDKLRAKFESLNANIPETLEQLVERLTDTLKAQSEDEAGLIDSMSTKFAEGAEDIKEFFKDVVKNSEDKYQSLNERLMDYISTKKENISERFSTDGDGFKEGSYKDVIAARAKNAAKRTKTVIKEKSESLRERAKDTGRGLVSGLLGDAAPVIGGALSILGGVLSFAGSTLGFMGSAGGMAVKLLGMLGVGKLMSSMLGKLNFLKKLPYGDKIVSMMGGFGSLFKGSDKVAAALGAASVAKSAADIVTGTSGTKGKSKKSSKPKKTSKFKGKGKFAALTATLAAAGIWFMNGDDEEEPMLTSADTSSETDKNILDIGTGSYNKIVVDDPIGSMRYGMIAPSASVAIAAYDSKDYKIVKSAREMVYKFIMKNGGTATKELAEDIIAGIGGRTSAVLNLLKKVKPLPAEKLLVLIKDMMLSLFYFLKGPAISGAIKSSIVWLFRSILKFMAKLLPILNVVDVWIYARIVGDVINELLEKYNIHVGIIIYDELEALGWNKYLEGTARFIGDSADAMVSFFRGTGITDAVSYGMEAVFNTAGDLYDKAFGEDKDTPKSKSQVMVQGDTDGGSDTYVASPAVKQVSRGKQAARMKVAPPPKTLSVDDYNPGNDTSGYKPLIVDPVGKPDGYRERKYKRFTGDTVYLPKTIDTRYLKLGKRTYLKGVNKAILMILSALSKEYYELTGKYMPINSAYRSAALQQALINEGAPAAPVGSSTHQYGIAIDSNSIILDDMDSLGLLSKYGLYRPYGRGEPHHIEPIGTQFNLARAKADPLYSYKRTLEGIGHGGGGPLGRRGRSEYVKRKVWHSGKNVKVIITDNPPETTVNTTDPSGSRVVDETPTMVADNALTNVANSPGDINENEKQTPTGHVFKPYTPTFDTNGLPEDVDYDQANAGVPYRTRSGTPATNLPPKPTTSNTTVEQKIIVEQDPDQKQILGKQLDKQTQTLLALQGIHEELKQMNRKPSTEVAGLTPRKVDTPLPKNISLDDGFGLA